MPPRFRQIAVSIVLTTLALAVFARSGIATRIMAGSPWATRRTVLRVWDWWSPATDEKYATYFSDVKREFEQAHPDVEVVFQYVPFGQYEQKMATALSGSSPPDVFQASVAFAEGLYDRGMLRSLNSYMDRER